MAVLLYVLLLRRGVPRWLAALAVAPVLLDAYQLQNEQTIMPGTLVRGPHRGRRRHPALAARPELAARRARRHRARHVGDRRAGGRGPDPRRRDLRTRGRRRLAAGHRQGGSAVRGLRGADPGVLHGLLPGHRGLLPVASGRHVALRPDGGGRRLRHDQAACRRSGACARPRLSRPGATTGSSSARMRPSSTTTGPCREPRSTTWSQASATACWLSSRCACSMLTDATY